MAEKILNTRILLKIDTLENWNSSTLGLKKGELAIATVAATAGNGLTEPVCMIKIGEDGVKTFKDLPWNFYAKASDVIAAAKSEDTLRTFVNGVIADAGIATSEAMEALAKRVTAAEGEIDTLQSEMDAVEAKAAANETAIGTLNGLVGDTKVADQITAAINGLNLATTYEAKGAAATVNTALETYKTSNDAKILEHTNAITANTNAIAGIKDGETLDSFKDVETALAGKEAAGAAADALTEAKAYADGLAGNYDAKGAAATAESNAKAYAKEYADGLAGNYDAKGTAAQALTDAKAYTDSEMDRLVGDETVGTQITNAITALDLANTYDAKGAAAAVDAKLTTHASEAAAAYETKTDASAKLTEAKGYTDTEVAKVQDEVDALETYVGTIPDGYTETNVVAYINKKAEETLNAASGGSSESAASVLGALNTYKAENDPKVQANTDAIAELEELVGDEKVSDAIAAAVKVEKERAEGIEGGLETRLAAVEANYATDADVEGLQTQINTIMNNPDAEGAINSINEFTQYVAEHGTIAEGMRTDINKNKDDIAAEVTRATGVESGLDTRLQAVEAAVGESGSVAGDIADALAEAKGYTDTEVKELADGAVADNAAAIADLEALVGDTEVATQITNVTNPMSEKITALEGKAHEHANKTVLDGVSAEKVTSWDAKVDDVIAAADSGLKATRTGNTVAVEIDDTVTFIFDCGTSAE